MNTVISESLPPSVGARVACEDRVEQSTDNQQSLSASASKLDGHGGGVILPENIEELIEAYLTEQAKRMLAVGIKYPHLIVSVSVIGGRLDMSRISCPVEGSIVSGSTLTEAVDKHIADFKSFDPLKDKQDQIARLQQECAQIEAERGMA